MITAELTPGNRIH